LISASAARIACNIARLAWLENRLSRPSKAVSAAPWLAPRYSWLLCFLICTILLWASCASPGSQRCCLKYPTSDHQCSALQQLLLQQTPVDAAQLGRPRWSY
jgi:hypothetical protein